MCNQDSFFFSFTSTYRISIRISPHRIAITEKKERAREGNWLLQNESDWKSVECFSKIC